MSRSSEEASGGMGEVRIEVTDDGPLVISGAPLIVDAEGVAFEAATDQPMVLCRCGGSQNKPFCDGSHVPGGFSANERASDRDQATRG